MCNTCIALYILHFFIVSRYVYTLFLPLYLLSSDHHSPHPLFSRCYLSYMSTLLCVTPKVVIVHASPSFPLSPNIANYVSLLLPYNPLTKTTTMITQPPLRPLLPRPIDTIIMSRNMDIRRCLC